MAEDIVLKRTLPNSIEAEQAVIGSIFIDEEAINVASEIITPADFFNKQYGIIYGVMLELYHDKKKIDYLTVADRLRSKEVPEDMINIEYLVKIVQMVPTSSNIKYYAEIVSSKATLRRLIRMSGDIENTCYEDKEPLEKILEDTEKKLYEVVLKRNSEEFEPIGVAVNRTIDGIEAAYKAGGSITGIPSGFIDLDYMTSGFHGSELILIAARPAMGKTAFVLNIAQNMAFKQGKNVAIFSLEMGKEQLLQRLFALEGNIEAGHLRNGRLDEDEWFKLTEAADTIADSNLVIDDSGDINVQSLRSKCRKYKMEHGLDVIIIDYLQLMSGGGRNESRQQEISEISRSLKLLARELNIPVIALSQLSRGVESRPDKRPMMSDLRESGAIEQDADVVMFIYRDDYYNKDTEKKNISEIIIGKQRSGPVGTIELAWLPEYTKFGNLEKRRNNQ